MANKLISNLSSGMNVKAPPLILKDTECEVILNYNLDTVGALTKRNGIATLGNQPVASKTILGMFQFNDTSAGTENQAIMVANNSGDTQSVIYELVSSTWTSRDTTSTQGIKARFATFIDYVFRVNGTDTVLTSANVTTWGTTNAPGTITPSFIAVFQDRVYVARNGTATASRLYFSALPSGSPLAITWATSTDYVDINPDDGDEITGLENNGNRLLVFKRRALYRWNYGQVEPDRLIGVGTRSQECVKTNLDLGITFFANEYGAYAYTGGRPKLISRKIQRWFDNVPAADVVNFAAEVDHDHYYLYLSDSMTVDGRTYTNVMAVYTISLDAWVIYTLSVPIRVMARFIRSSSEDIYFGSTDGRIYQFLTGTNDNTAAINGEILTKEHLLAFPNKVSLQYIDILSQQRVNASVAYDIDRRNEWRPAGNLTDRVTTFPLGGKEVRTVRLRISDNSTNTSIIEGYNFEFEPLNKRK